MLYPPHLLPRYWCSSGRRTMYDELLPLPYSTEPMPVTACLQSRHEKGRPQQCLVCQGDVRAC